MLTNLASTTDSQSPTDLQILKCLLTFLQCKFNWTATSAKPRVYLGIPFTRVTVNLD